jgi:hypothetical protein
MAQKCWRYCKEGDLLAEIETDKAVQDFESEFNGVLLKQGVEEGGAAPVDSFWQLLALQEQMFQELELLKLLSIRKTG